MAGCEFSNETEKRIWQDLKADGKLSHISLTFFSCSQQLQHRILPSTKKEWSSSKGLAFSFLIISMFLNRTPIELKFFVIFVAVA
jgi:hypothetical protein